MSEVAEPKATVPPKRRWFRFRLRTLLIVLTVISVALGLYVRSARIQQEAVQAIRDYGGWVRYDFQFPSGTFAVNDFDANASSGVPQWIFDRLGPDLFHTVVEVNLSFSDDSGQREDNENSSDEALRYVARLPNVRRVLLSGTQATDASMVHLAELRKLEDLYMWDAEEVSDAGVEHLEQLSRLKFIHISNSRISDGSLQVFGRMPQLESLSLQENRFTNRGIAHLIGLKRLTALWIGIGDTEITDSAVPYLLQLDSLQTLDLQRTDVTESGIAQLKARFPQIRIIDP